MTAGKRKDDTSMGGPHRDVVRTPWTMILSAREADTPARREAMGRLLSAYWKPIYLSIRHGWKKSNEAAKDLTQEFFAEMLEKDFIETLSPERGRFRGFIKACLNNFLVNQNRRAGRVKRGGDRLAIPIDISELKDYIPAVQDTPERILDREWGNLLLKDTMERMRLDLEKEGLTRQYELFVRYETGQTEGSRTRYDDLAVEASMDVGLLKSQVADCRRRLRCLVEERVRTYCESEDDVKEEIAELLS